MWTELSYDHWRIGFRERKFMQRRGMRNNWIGFICMVLFWASGLHAASGDSWYTDYEEARAIAAEEGKVIFIKFHGSDWCPPCIALSEQVLSKEAFLELADKKLVLVDADFPRKTRLSPQQEQHNRELGRRFGLRVFPTIVLVQPDGSVLKKMSGYPEGGLDGFLDSMREVLPAEEAGRGDS